MKKLNVAIIGQGRSGRDIHGEYLLNKGKELYNVVAVVDALEIRRNRAKEEFEMPEWREWAESLGIEGEFEGIGHLALGYPDGALPKASPRRECRTS